MTTAGMVLRAQTRNVARSRWVLSYALLLFGLTELLLWFGGSGERALLSLLNVVLLVLPLVSVVFGTLYIYHSREFIETLLAQPVSRGALYAGLFGGMALPLSGAFLLAVGGPLVLQGSGGGEFGRQLAALLGAGTLLTLVFTGFALCVAVLVDDRAWGLGAALLVWLLCTVVYDGIVLLVVSSFRHWPLETPVLVLLFLNPVDLARTLLLLTLDISALMGYTGAVYERFFGTPRGTGFALGMLLLCAAIPLGLGYHWFQRKDF